MCYSRGAQRHSSSIPGTTAALTHAACPVVLPQSRCPAVSLLSRRNLAALVWIVWEIQLKSGCSLTMLFSHSACSCCTCPPALLPSRGCCHTAALPLIVAPTLPPPSHCDSRLVAFSHCCAPLPGCHSQLALCCPLALCACPLAPCSRVQGSRSSLARIQSNLRLVHKVRIIKVCYNAFGFRIEFRHLPNKPICSTRVY